jgi:CO/xanthine dehydrogenase FAD-binding subunit
MDFIRPETWAEALEVKATHPDIVPIAGGTDVMVELNFDRRRPPGLLDLSGIPDLATWEVTGDNLRLGAGVTYARVIDEIADLVPGLAMAARTVGSPQIRNRGTVGGNLGAASPAGDSHPALIAGRASVELQSVRGSRTVPIDRFYTGVKRNCLAPDELIAAVWMPKATGPQQFCKIGTRNAMVISVTGFGLALWPEQGAVGAGIGSAAPTPRRAAQAEAFLGVALASFDLWSSRKALPQAVIDEFTGLVRADAAPIDDVRGTRPYRLHALSVMAGRALRWAWRDYCSTTGERKVS